jgi:hypothetical protein
VLFAHSLGLTDQTYPRFLHDLASAGFVVADPEFPLSSSALPGPASSGDVVEQARDLGFVADQLLDPATRPPPLDRVSFSDELGVIGSLGWRCDRGRFRRQLVLRRSTRRGRGDHVGCHRSIPRELVHDRDAADTGTPRQRRRSESAVIE